VMRLAIAALIASGTFVACIPFRVDDVPEVSGVFKSGQPRGDPVSVFLSDERDAKGDTLGCNNPLASGTTDASGRFRLGPVWHTVVGLPMGDPILHWRLCFGSATTPSLVVDDAGIERTPAAYRLDCVASTELKFVRLLGDGVVPRDARVCEVSRERPRSKPLSDLPPL
jgi:hypothetical protein